LENEFVTIGLHKVTARKAGEMYFLKLRQSN